MITTAKPVPAGLRPTSLAAPILVAALMVGGCGQDPEALASAPEPAFDGPVVARINGTDVTEPLLMAYLRMRGQIAADEEARSAALRDLANLYLLADKAERDGLTARTTVQAELELQRIRRIADLTLSVAAQNQPVTDEELQHAYDAEVSRTGETEYRVHHILSPSEEEARDLLARLAAGEAFATLESAQAERYGVSAAGDLGWVNLAQVPESFGPAISRLEAGQYSADPVQSEYGWHVIRLEDQRRFTPPPLDEVKDGIRATLMRTRAEDLITRLHEEGDVELFPR